MSFSDLPVSLRAYFLCLSLLIGACAGSFLNCAALRRPRGEKLPRGRSHCPECGHVLGLLDLVPVFSWLFLGGKCRYCKAKISPRYPVTELVSAGAFALTFWRFGLTVLTAEHWVLFGLLLYLSLVDLDSMELPDGPVLAAAVLFLTTLPFAERPLSRLLWGLAAAVLYGGGLLLLSLIMDKVLGRESLGGGDVKLLAALALWCGPGPGIFLILLAALLGLLFAAVLKKRGPFPFGPALSLAALPVILAGERLWGLYLGLFS